MSICFWLNFRKITNSIFEMRCEIYDRSKLNKFGIADSGAFLDSLCV